MTVIFCDSVDFGTVIFGIKIFQILHSKTKQAKGNKICVRAFLIGPNMDL